MKLWASSDWRHHFGKCLAHEDRLPMRSDVYRIGLRTLVVATVLAVLCPAVSWAQAGAPGKARSRLESAIAPAHRPVPRHRAVQRSHRRAGHHPARRSGRTTARHDRRAGGGPRQHDAGPPGSQSALRSSIRASPPGTTISTSPAASRRRPPIGSSTSGTSHANAARTWECRSSRGTTSATARTSPGSSRATDSIRAARAPAWRRGSGSLVSRCSMRRASGTSAM